MTTVTSACLSNGGKEGRTNLKLPIRYYKYCKYTLMWTWFSVIINWSICCWGLSFFNEVCFQIIHECYCRCRSIFHWDTWSWMVKDSKVVLHFVTYIFIRGWNISRGIQCMIFWFFLSLWEVKLYEIKKRLSTSRFCVLLWL